MLNTKTNLVNEKVEIDPKDLQVSFDNNTTEKKDEKTKDDSKIVKVSLGNNAKALEEEMSKPKEKQDKDKIKQLEKSIKDREKEIKKQVENNKKNKPVENAWKDVIDDENADDWSYIANNWANIPKKEDFKHIANKTINKDITNVSKDREYYLNLSQRGFEEWNGMQENPDDPDNYKKWEEENQKWKNNAKEILFKYMPGVIKPYLTKYEIDEIDPAYVKKAYNMAMNRGDYDAAVILQQVMLNTLKDEIKAKVETSDETSDETTTETSTETTTTEKPAEEGKQTFTKEKAWEIYNSPSGTARGLFENFNTLGMTAEEARKEFLSKNPNPSENAKNAFRDIYKSELVESKVTASEEEQTEGNKDSQVGGKTKRKTLNEAQSEVSKNIKDLLLDEAYQTLTDDEKREALKKETEKALNKNSLKFIDKVNTREDAAQLSKFLPRFAIQHFLEENFGDKKDLKSWGILGYFLLDKIGKSLINASQVARGLSPTEKTALEDYNETMMKNAFGRDDENRRKILNSSIDTLIKDSDVLRELGISDFKIFDDFTEKVLTQYQDNIQNVNLDKILKEKADFIENLPEKEKNTYIGYIIATGVSDPDSAEYLIAAYREAEMELKFAKTDAEKYAAEKSKLEIDLKLLGMEESVKTVTAQLDSIKLKNEKDRATMTAEIDQAFLENKQLEEDIKKARTENKYLEKEKEKELELKEKELEQKVATIVSTYASVGTNIGDTVANIIDAITGRRRK